MERSLPNPILTQILESKKKEVSLLPESLSGLNERSVPLVRDFLSDWRQRRGLEDFPEDLRIREFPKIESD